LIVYFLIGQQFASLNMNNEDIQAILTALQQNFVISPWLLLVPVIVILLVVKKTPALPALIVGLILGFLCHIFVQGGSVAEAVNVLHNGYSIETGNELADELFNRGGIESM